MRWTGWFVALALGVVLGMQMPRPGIPPAPVSAPSPTVQRVYQDAPRQEAAVAAPALRGSAQPSVGFSSIADAETVFDRLYMAYRVAADASPGELESLVREALSYTDPLYHHNIALIFLEKMIADDLEAALSFAEGLAEGENRLVMISSVLNTWAMRDEPAALAYFESISSPALRQRVASSFLSNKSLGAGFRRDVQSALGAYGDRLATAIELREGSPAEQFAAAVARSGGEDRRRAVLTAGMQWFRHNPERAVQEVGAMPPSQERTALLHNMLQEWVTRDADRALEYLALLAPDDRQVQSGVLHRLARRDPVGALPHVENYMARFNDPNILNNLLGSWVKEDPQAAVAYADKLPPETRRNALWQLSRGYLQAAPEEALDWLVAQQDAQLLRMAARQLPESLMDDAEVLLASVTDQETRRGLMSSIAASRGRQDPADALNWLERFEGEPGFGQVVAESLHHWARQSPETAAAYLEQQGGDPAFAQGYQGVASVWYQRDPAAAERWVMQLPDSVSRDRAVASLVQNAAHRDRDTAIELLAALPAGEIRNQSALAIARAEARGDRDRLLSKLVELGVPEADAERYASGRGVIDSVDGFR